VVKGLILVTDIVVLDEQERIHTLVDQKLSGMTVHAIARANNMKVVDVNSVLSQWRELAKDIPALKDRAKEALAGADQHYDRLIGELYKIVEEADEVILSNGADSKMLGVKQSALKTIADLESKRFGMLKEAGLMDDAELANQIVDSEKKIEAVKQVLREVSSTCPRCKVMVAERLSEIDGRAVPIKIIVEEPSGSN
jgi:hypothetical protein